MGELHAKLGVGSAMMWILINTTGPTGAEGAGGTGRSAGGQWRGPAAVPVGGGRARAGFEIDHSEPLGSRVAISRAAGPDGARNTSGAAINKLNRKF